MRPAVVDWLNEAFGSEVFAWLVPYPALVYSLTMLVCLLVFVRRSRQACLTPYNAVGAALAAMIGGLIGARLLYLALWRPPPAQLVSEMLRVAGGTISWGAYLGGFAAFCGYLLVRRQELLPYLDVLGSVLGLGPFLGRWACFLNGCDFGRTTPVPWAVEYPHGSIPFVAQVRQEILDPLAAHSLPVHPVQLYLSVNGLLLFVLFSYLWRSRRWPAGTIFFGYWTAYGATRFVLEFLRGNTVTFYLEVLSIGQVMATAVTAVSLLAMFGTFRRHAASSSSFTDDTLDQPKLIGATPTCDHRREIEAASPWLAPNSASRIIDCERDTHQSKGTTGGRRAPGVR